MKTWVKVLLGCGLLAVLAVGALVVVGGWLIRRSAPAIEAMGKQADAEAKTWAVGHDQQDCVDEMFKRGDACGAGMQITCEVKARLFGTECMRQATKTDAFCDAVPTTGEIMASVKWQTSTCAALGRQRDDRCGRLLQSKQDYCARP